MGDDERIHISRDVNVTGGDFVAGNKTIINQPGPAPAELTPEQLAAAETRYRAQVVERYNRLGFAGLGVGDLRLSDVPLDDVFVRLTLTVEKEVPDPTPPKERERKERSRNPFRRGEKKEDERPRERTITVQEPITLGEALTQHALIVGEPGAGKSTLLRWLAVIFAAGSQRETDRLGPQADADRLPLLVELGRLPEAYLQGNSRETPNWKSFLPEHLTKQPAFDDIPAAFLEQALAAGRCLLLCDGLDEIADLSARRRMADSLADYARSSANRLVLSSRPAGVSGSEASLGSRFQRLTIQRLAPQDVRRFFGFLCAQYEELTPAEQAKEADALYAAVQSQPKTLELATTPLLATLLLLLWNQDGYLPERRVELYERCCQMLIESWEAQHDVAYTGALAEIGWERHLRLLAPLAYAIHNTGQRTDAPASELIPVLAQVMQTEGLAPPASATLEAEKFLRTLSLRSGLLQFLGNDRYGFPHLTFQEYLTARHIAAQPDPDYIDLVMVHLHKAWWREVHLLVIGHLGSGEEGAVKASRLLEWILDVYPPPWGVFRLRRIDRLSSYVTNMFDVFVKKNKMHRALELFALLLLSPLILSLLLLDLMYILVNKGPAWQLEQRLAWMLGREILFAATSYSDYVKPKPNFPLRNRLAQDLSIYAREVVSDPARLGEDAPTILLAVVRCLKELGESTKPMTTTIMREEWPHTICSTWVKNHRIW
jgi:energy-coupling factor transporter ATP-binding protein EcfA2